jgi:two-component system, NarL family, nitrate/nitrite response regulator NarL
MPSSIRVVVIDDHPLFREGATQLLANTPGLSLVADGSTATDAINIAQRLLPDIMLLDLKLPGGGIEATTAIVCQAPTVRIIILTASECDEDVATVLQLGARGYLLKGSSGPEIVHAVRTVFNGDPYVAPALAARLLTQLSRPDPIAAKEGVEDLTDRENHILVEVSKGMTNKEIARHLDLSEKTIKHYMTKIMQKLNVRNRMEAVLRIQKKEGPSRSLAKGWRAAVLRSVEGATRTPSA